MMTERQCRAERLFPLLQSKYLTNLQSIDQHVSNSHRRRRVLAWKHSQKSVRRRSLPLSEKTRVEVYLPDLPTSAYQRLLETLRREFTYTFGGSTLVSGLGGTYLSRSGLVIEDRVSLLYADAFLDFEADAALIEQYAEAIQRAAYRALDEEAILIVVHSVQHSG
jgi:hypothetical protein